MKHPAHEYLNEADTKLKRLKEMNPFLLDVSLRENAVGDSMGQTLEEKIELFPKLRAFGFQNIVLGTLNYSFPEELEVDDDFMMHLRDHHIDRTGCFAFTSIGILDGEGQFIPDPSQLKLIDYQVPHTVHEIYLTRDVMADLYDRETLIRSIPASISWLHENTLNPRIIMNIVDGCDAFIEDPDFVFEILELLSQQNIEGVSFQDDRGTFLPFQVGAFTKAARSILSHSQKLLIHIHGGSGVENASVIEALLNGADGVWGALPKCGPIIGHASLGELIANLVRIQNPHMTAFQLKKLIPLSSPESNMFHFLHESAYRLNLSFFRQTSDRFMDLTPDELGGEYAFRISPLISDPKVIAGRLAEITHKYPSEFSEDVLIEMIKLMRRNLRAGKKIAYDHGSNLIELHNQAVQNLT